ncbi:hypothetical protein [Terriglobus roseus]|uniref:hypothetical protein n=1 Tax=Terriglobus roseus TaxID=392734 RepID=UPI0012F6AECF|nr:hypothetical protein [Terriglobus roseus]
MMTFVGASLYSAFVQTHASEILKVVAGSVTLLTALGQALAKANLKFYLLWQRIWIMLHGSETAIWRFGLRVDGDLGSNVLEDFAQSAKSSLEQWHPEIHSCSDSSLRMKVDRTIHLHAQLEHAAFSEDGVSHFLVRSDELEVPYASARAKIEQCIVPLLGIIARQWPGAEHSTMFEVSFRKKNPFFAFFVAHLDPKQVTQFNLVFHPAAITRDGTDRVVVTQNSLHIDAGTTESFAQLSKAFILMSSEIASVTNL